MKTIKVNNYFNVPIKFTGIADFDSGTLVWFLDGRRHRVDGPAVEYADGIKVWWLNGEFVSEEEHAKRTAYLRTTLGKLIFNEHFKLEE
jgi:hypothetical protein